jgi:hypothetical protein
MYDPNALAAVMQWLPVVFIVGIAIIAGVLWSVLR